MSKESNFFDDLLAKKEDEIDQNAQREEQGKRLDYLIHRVFEQSQEGKELINVWKDTLIMQPTAIEGMDMVGIGIREGQKRMIRGIVLTIKRVEGE